VLKKRMHQQLATLKQKQQQRQQQLEAPRMVIVNRSRAISDSDHRLTLTARLTVTISWLRSGGRPEMPKTPERGESEKSFLTSPDFRRRSGKGWSMKEN